MLFLILIRYVVILLKIGDVVQIKITYLRA